MGARERERKGRLLPFVVYLHVDEPSRSDGALAAAREPTEMLRGSASGHYGRVIIGYLFSGSGGDLELIKLGFFRGFPARRRRGARRGIVAGILAGVLDAYRASGVACRVSRVVDTRMTAAEYRAAAKSYPGAEGSGIDEECGISAREAGIGIECPRCGKMTTMARRGDYPWDGEAEAGMEEWRGRGLAGEPRPTLQWVRPHGKCDASNSHSLVILPAGAPRSGRFRGGFVLVRTFVHPESVPHVYGAG